MTSPGPPTEEIKEDGTSNEQISCLGVFRWPGPCRLHVSLGYAVDLSTAAADGVTASERIENAPLVRIKTFHRRSRNAIMQLLVDRGDHVGEGAEPEDFRAMRRLGSASISRTLGCRFE